MASIIKDQNKFILETSQHVLHALLTKARHNGSDPRGLAKLARKYAHALWLEMRHPF